jgi:hypothetical protein
MTPFRFPSFIALEEIPPFFCKRAAAEKKCRRIRKNKKRKTSKRRCEGAFL